MPLPNFKSQFSEIEEVGSYDNIALNQRFNPLLLQCADLQSNRLYEIFEGHSKNLSALNRNFAELLLMKDEIQAPIRKKQAQKKF